MAEKELHEKARDALSLFNLKGKVALVTGGAKGLGEAMALALAGPGPTLQLPGRPRRTTNGSLKRSDEWAARSRAR